MAFLVFLGIALFFWFLRALEKEYITHIDHPVVYQNLPAEHMLVNSPPTRLRLEVSGTGFSILRHNWDISKSPVKINIRQFMTNQNATGESLTWSVQSAQMKGRIDNQLSNLTVMSILPDVLHFEFSREYAKKVPVIPDLDIELEKQFMIRNGLVVTPDSVTIEGPGVLIDTISRVYTDQQQFKKLSNSLRRSLALVKPHPQVILSEKRVTIEVPVEQYTEKSLSVAITPVNIPDSLTMKTFPARAEVTFRVVVSAFDQIQETDFTIHASYQDILPGNQKIRLKLAHFPGLIENPRLHPETVDFLLEKQ